MRFLVIQRLERIQKKWSCRSVYTRVGSVLVRLLASQRSTKFFSIFLVSILLTGCGGGGTTLDRQAIQGSVTREAQPIDTGNLLFEPLGGGPGVSADITDGKYNVPKESGPVPGSYKVKIVHFPRRIPAECVPKKDWNVSPEDRFKGEQPPGGWNATAEVVKGQVAPIDFKVGE